MMSEKRDQKFHTDDCHYLNLGRGNFASTNQKHAMTTKIWIVTSHHLGISALVSQFFWETYNDGVTKRWLFSQATMNFISIGNEL